MALLSAIYTGHSGLAAASAGLAVTTQNVTNAATPGYTRRGLSLSAATPLAQGGLLLGQGVRVDAITRPMDALLGMRRVTEAGVAVAARTAADALTTVETWFDESTRPGPRMAMDSFFDALMSATADPSDRSLRQDVIYQAQGLADTLRGTAEGLSEAANSLEDGLGSRIAPLNELLKRVATLNGAIAAQGGPQVAGDLADQRDQALRSLAEMGGFTVHFDTNGDATVFLGGHAVVSGAEARTLSLDDDGSDPVVRLSTGSAWVDVTDMIGGEMGGLLTALERTRSYQDELDTFAVALVDAINERHRAGFDRDGVAGADFFVIDPTRGALSIAVSDAVDDPDRLAFAAATDGGIGDGGNLASLLALVDDPAMPGGRTPGDMISALTTRVGTELNQTRNLADQREAMLGDLDALASRLQDVDLDEETTNLLVYQTAYQAAAKVVQTADSMLATLMELK